MLMTLFVFRFNVLTRGSLYRKLLAYSDSGLLVNGYLVRKVSTKLDKELEKGTKNLSSVVFISNHYTSVFFSVAYMLLDRGLLFSVRRHPQKHFLQVQTGPSTAWRSFRKPEDLLREEREALTPYEWHHIQFLRVSLLYTSFFWIF